MERSKMLVTLLFEELLIDTGIVLINSDGGDGSREVIDEILKDEKVLNEVYGAVTNILERELDNLIKEEEVGV